MPTSDFKSIKVNCDSRYKLPHRCKIASGYDDMVGMVVNPLLRPGAILETKKLAASHPDLAKFADWLSKSCLPSARLSEYPHHRRGRIVAFDPIDDPFRYSHSCSRNASSRVYSLAWVQPRRHCTALEEVKPCNIAFLENSGTHRKRCELPFWY